MGQYKWITYNQVTEKVGAIGSGLRFIGMIPHKSKLVIFNNTCAEWFLSAHGCFSQSMTICTVYATLGFEALVFAFNEIEVEYILTELELLPEFEKALPKIGKTLKVIIYSNPKEQVTPDRQTIIDRLKKNNITVYSIDDIIDFGRKKKITRRTTTAKRISCYYVYKWHNR